MEDDDVDNDEGWIYFTWGRPTSSSEAGFVYRDHCVVAEIYWIVYAFNSIPS